ncbi:MAG: hypothetical protein IPL79_11410 [Myxococcales bacterium]|nr:hypothetical protein [Myxococcales bacterium]
MKAAAPRSPRSRLLLTLLSSLAMSAAACDRGEDTPPPVPGEDPKLGPSGCKLGFAGVPCLMAAMREATFACDAERVADLVEDLQARRGHWAMWHDQTAMFVAEEAGDIAGSFNDWQPTLALTQFCDSALYVADVALTSGTHQYKIVRGDDYELDSNNWAFAYDAFEGNADGRNSVLNTYDSGRGHLEASPAPLCSEALSNCREVKAYVPAGYAAPTRKGRYPVLYVHDGQNVFDDATCCFNGSGWELNLTADEEIAAGRAAPFIIVAADHGGLGRGDEYGWVESAGGKQAAFMAFQVQSIQPDAEARWDIDGARRFVLGSSLGGLISYRLAFAYPDVYIGAGAMSGAFWPGLDTQTGMLDLLATLAPGDGPDVAIYLDHGGSVANDNDGMEDSVDVAEALEGLGYARQVSPTCSPDPRALCYHHELGASHSESAWRARAWRPMRFFFAP